MQNDVITTHKAHFAAIVRGGVAALFNFTWKNRALLFLFFLIFFQNLKAELISNPYYDLRDCGKVQIDSIERTKELTEQLRKNRTIDWSHKDSARAKMRVMVKRLLKKYHYPTEGQEQALNTVMAQCNKWADDEDNFVVNKPESAHMVKLYPQADEDALPMAAEDEDE